MKIQTLKLGQFFEKGKELGTTDIVLKVFDGKPLHLYLNGNNYGMDLTTNTRIGGRLDGGNIIAYGDKISLAEVVGFPINALYFTDVKYSFLLNKRGTALESAYLFSKFKIEEQKSLGLRGESNIGTLKLHHALTRKRFLSIDFFSSFDIKQIENFEKNRITSFDKLRVLTVGFSFDHMGKYGRDYFVLRGALGIPDFLGGLRAVSDESSRVGGGGKFYKLNGDYDHLQPFFGCFFHFHASFQLSPSKLTMPEQIYIGGSDTVRGFPISVKLGDSGFYSNFEFHFPIPFLANKNAFKLNKKWKEVIQFNAFFDTGATFLHSIQKAYLSGTGFGVKITGPYSLTLNIDVGFPLNNKDLSKGAFTYIKLTGQAF